MSSETLYQLTERYLKETEPDAAELLPQEPMKNHTSFQIGGPADLLVLPRSLETAAGLARFYREREIPCMLLGNGTNLLVSDRGIRGVVLGLSAVENPIERTEDGLRCPSGALLVKAASFACREGLAGLEFAHGIPGSLGGAVFMNAGAYGGEMKDIVTETEFLDENGERRSIRGEEHGFSYRKSVFSGRKCVILSTRLRLRPGDREEIQAKMDGLMARRREKQPLELPSAGSVFKRPAGHFAGTLIQESGLRGYRIGGAAVSEKHCGFIVNLGGATCQDVLRLVEHIQQTVEARTGVRLECEIRKVGE